MPLKLRKMSDHTINLEERNFCCVMSCTAPKGSMGVVAMLKSKMAASSAWPY